MRNSINQKNSKLSDKKKETNLLISDLYHLVFH